MLMSRRLIILFVLPIVAGVVGAWIWRTSPVLRHKFLNDATSFTQAFETLKKGDTIEHVRDALGDRYLGSDDDESIRHGFRGLATSFPEHHPDGCQDSDIVLVYSTSDAGRHGILFRDDRI